MTEAFSLADPLQYARFRERARALEPSLIVIDTVAEVLDIGDWSSRVEIYAKIAPIRRLARSLCTVLLVAHNRNPEGDMGDEMTGSNALTGTVDGWISAYRAERRANGSRRLSLRVEGRGGLGHELIAEMDHNTLHFTEIHTDQAEGDAQTSRQRHHAARRQAKLELARSVLRDHGSLTITELASLMRVSYNSAWALIRDLQKNGAVDEIQPTPNPDAVGRPAPTYTLHQP